MQHLFCIFNSCVFFFPQPCRVAVLHECCGRHHAHPRLGVLNGVFSQPLLSLVYLVVILFYAKSTTSFS